jgi:hypothetical protein
MRNELHLHESEFRLAAEIFERGGQQTRLTHQWQSLERILGAGSFSNFQHHFLEPYEVCSQPYKVLASNFFVRQPSSSRIERASEPMTHCEIQNWESHLLEF